VVDVAGRWGEGYYSYPGRSDILVCQKSAEAILAGNTSEGLNMKRGIKYGKFEKHIKKAENSTKSLP